MGGVPESGCNGEARSERPDNREAGVAPGPVGSNPTPSATWWRPGVGGPGRHPGCTCPMTGEKPAWHHDDCAAHDDDAREIEDAT